MKIKNGKVKENIISLFTLKGTEYIIQFMTLPYLLRVLGPDKYGAIILSQAIVNYIALIVDYGFNITAPKDIATSKRKDWGINFSAICVAKMFLFIISICVGMMLLFCISNAIDRYLLVCVLPMVIGNIIFPIWFFQGIQEMRFITIFNLAARIVSVACIFTLVNNKSDYYLAALFQSSVPLIAGGISLVVLYRKYKDIFIVPGWSNVVIKFKEGWDIFVSTLFINLYTNTNIFVLGIMTNDTVVGYYAAANKLVEALKGLMSPISNAVFPHISLLFRESKEKAVIFLCRVLHKLGGVMLIVSIFLCILAPYIVRIIMGSGYNESVAILRIISFLPFIIALSNIFGIQTMVAFGMQRIFSRILMFSALLNFILIFPMIYMWQGIGLAITVVIVESFVTITMYVLLRKNNIILR